jgi:hypothetical protein
LNKLLIKCVCIFYYGSLDVMYNTLEETNRRNFYSGVVLRVSQFIFMTEALFLCMEGTGKAYQVYV